MGRSTKIKTAIPAPATSIPRVVSTKRVEAERRRKISRDEFMNTFHFRKLSGKPQACIYVVAFQIGVISQEFLPAHS
jgi:hypothetical protein